MSLQRLSDTLEVENVSGRLNSPSGKSKHRQKLAVVFACALVSLSLLHGQTSFCLDLFCFSFLGSHPVAPHAYSTPISISTSPQGGSTWTSSNDRSGLTPISGVHLDVDPSSRRFRCSPVSLLPCDRHELAGHPYVYSSRNVKPLCHLLDRQHGNAIKWLEHLAPQNLVERVENRSTDFRKVSLRMSASSRL